MTIAYPRFVDYVLYGELHCLHCNKPLTSKYPPPSSHYEHVDGTIECQPEQADNQ